MSPATRASLFRLIDPQLALWATDMAAGFAGLVRVRRHAIAVLEVPCFKTCVLRFAC